MRAIIITAALLGAACSGCVPKAKPCKCECKNGRELPYQPPQVWEVGEERR